MRLPALAVALAACRSASPDSDCARVRAAAATTPRRYQGEIVAEKLAKTTFANADIQAAVRAGDLAKLESLCGGLTGTPIDWREQECKAVAMYVPTVENEAKGVGIFDPSVANMSFRDPEIRAEMKALVDSGWSPSARGYDATPNPHVAKLRALCNF